MDGDKTHSGPTERAMTARIVDVARLAGVSTATVSRALSNPGRVNTETRRRVLEAVSALGYTPNAAARNLRARRSMMVLVVVPKLANVFFAQVLRGIDSELFRSGYGLIIGDLDTNYAFEKEKHLVALVNAGHIDGVITIFGGVPRNASRAIIATGVPVVGLCAQTKAPGVPNVLVDDYGGSRKATEHLLGLGHRALMFVGGTRQNYNTVHRLRGFRAALAAHGLDPKAAPMVFGDYTFGSGVEAAEAFLALEQKPTGIVCASDEMAIGFMATVRQAGFRIPRDLSVIGFDDIEFSRFTEPPLTTIAQPRVELGRSAARTILARIRGEAVEEPPHIDCPIVVRGSTGPPPKKRAAAPTVGERPDR